ncbi:MAG: hypothetical protein IPL47_12820 [Phyllobacteriaceae bacterium]|nr:hypothetical protein [Phyllobacteriaceae bacterium]
MDWELAVEKNREQLVRIVATLFAYAGLDDGAAPAALPRLLRNALLRLIRPAESAVRRLIVIAARGVKVTLRNTPLRPPERKPKGGHLPHKGGDRLERTPRPALTLGAKRSRCGTPISPLVGEMAGRPEGGAEKPAPAFPLFDPRKRFAG